MYTYHSYRIFVPLTLIVSTLFFYKKKRLKELYIPLIVIFVLSMPLILFSLTSQGQIRFLQTSAFAQSISVQEFLFNVPINCIIFINNYFSYFSITYLFHYGDQINRHQIQNFGLLYLWQLPYCFLGLYYLRKTKNALLRFFILFHLLIGPIPSSLTLPSPHTLRFLLGTIPFTLLTMLGVYELYKQNKRWAKRLLYMTIIVACVEFAYYLNYYFIQYPRKAQLDWGGACKQVTKYIQHNSFNYAYIIIDRNLNCIPEYFSFYIPDISVRYVSVMWHKPSRWNNKKILYIRPYYGNKMPEHLIQNIYLTNINHDIFAQAFRL